MRKKRNRRRNVRHLILLAPVRELRALYPLLHPQPPNLLHQEKDLVPSAPDVVLDLLHLELDEVLHRLRAFDDAEAGVVGGGAAVVVGVAAERQTAEGDATAGDE